MQALAAAASGAAPVTAGHFIFIPSVMLVGIVIGWILGSRAARDAYATELRRREERAAQEKSEVRSNFVLRLPVYRPDRQPLRPATSGSPAFDHLRLRLSTGYSTRNSSTRRVSCRRSRRPRAGRRRAAGRPIRD